MIRRALIHVAGPPEAGKTTLIERLLEKQDYSEAVFIEGDCPVEYVDLSVFVAPAPLPDEALLRRVVRDHTAEHRASIERYAAAFETRESSRGYLAKEVGEPLAALASRRPELLDDFRESMKRGLAQARQAPPPAPTEHWALGERYQGLERAQLVVVNVRQEDDRRRADDLCGEMPRLRKDPAVFDDVIGRSGNRVPITAVAANLGDPRDTGFSKCFNRVRRTLRSVSG